MRRRLITIKKRISDNMTLSEMRQRRKELKEAGDFKVEKFHRHSEQEFIRAIKLSDGYQTRVAKLLGLTCGAVSQRIKKSEKLQEVLDEILQGLLDLAEVKLIEAVNNKEPWSIMFVLRSKGRSRGWGEKVNIDATIRPAGGVLVVPPQVSSSEEFERIAIKTQRELEYKIDHGFNDDHGEDEEEYQNEEEKFIEQSYIIKE